MEIIKAYYSISEVAKELELEAHVLRFWEGEFGSLRPKKNRSGNRAYQKKDIELLEKIKHLLYEELYTIDGARKKLKNIKHIPLQDYIKTSQLLGNKDFVAELQNMLDFI
jgi:DNA-binding transcriptional MerR regulator